MMRPPYKHLVAACHLRRLHDLLVAAGVVVDAVGERVPDIGETGMILSRLEQRQCDAAELLRFVDGALADPEPHLCRERARECGTSRVPVGIGPSCSRLEEGS